MTRPGFVLQVDDRTPDLLTLSGSRVQLQRFPKGTQVVYPPDAMPSSDPVPLVDGALASQSTSASVISCVVKKIVVPISFNLRNPA